MWSSLDAVAGFQRQALGAGVEVEAAQDPVDAVLGDPDRAPLGSAELGGDPPGAKARMAEAEGEDPVLEVGPELVRHPRAPALSDPKSVESVALKAWLPGVVG